MLNTDNNNNKPKDAYIQLAMLATVGFGLQTYWRYESSRLGDNSGTLQLSQTNFFALKSTPMNVGIIFMFIFLIASLLLYPFLSYFCHKAIKKSILKKDPKEKIVFTYKPLAPVFRLVPIFAPFALYAASGWFFGCYIIPFLIFPNITHIDMVTHNNLFLYMILFFILLLSAFAFQYNTVILTEKQLINSFPFLPFWTKNILLNDIKHIQQIDNAFIISSKAGKTISISIWEKRKLDIFKQNLRGLLQKKKEKIDGYRN